MATGVILSVVIHFAFLLMTRGATAALESVPDLEKAMYLNVESFPCVRLLNISGEVGCSNPGNEKIIAPIVRLEKSTHQLASWSAVLLPLAQMNDFFLRVLHDPEFSQNVAGVMVEPMNSHENLSELSPERKFPLAPFAPYEYPSYEWNPGGSGIMWNSYNFPVFLLSEESTPFIQEVSERNAKRRNSYGAYMAEFDLVMQTTKVASHNSESCLKEQLCLPLGGQSVWSSLPPINISSSENQKATILVAASMDSASFFRDKSLGADSPISGLIALLAAVDALSRIDGLSKLSKQLVFGVFTGEAWGYLGSRKFLHELDLNSEVVKGLNFSNVEQVLEIGSVGKGSVENGTNFFAHTGGLLSGQKLLQAFKEASISLGSDNVTVEAASSSNPGLPPSSLMTFIRKNSSIAGLVLEDFDSAFVNKFYHSHLDIAANVNSSSIAAAAALVARSLYILANDGQHVDALELSRIAVNVTLVEELIRCLLTCDPGLSCGIFKHFISPRNACPSHYVGVYLDPPAGSQRPEYADDTARFIWNFLAERTSFVSANSSSCTGECSNEGEICVGMEVEGHGKCVISTTRYVPAYSTRLKYEDNVWHVLPPNSSDPMGAVDPIWTESFWNTIGLRAYAVQSTTYDLLIFFGGVLLTVASYIAVSVGRSCLLKAVKRD